jgi:hypothetical protein
MQETGRSDAAAGTAGKQQCQATGWRCKAQKNAEGESAAELWGGMGAFYAATVVQVNQQGQPKLCNRCREQQW